MRVMLLRQTADLVNDVIGVLLERHDGVRDLDVNRNDYVFNVERTFQSHRQQYHLIYHTPAQSV